MRSSNQRVQRSVWLVLLWWCVVALDIRAQAQTPAPPTPLPFTVTLEPERIVNGEPCIFRVLPRKRLRALTATWLEKRLFFDYDAASQAWYTVAGTSVDLAPGEYPLVIQALLMSGEEVTSTHNVPVGATRYLVTTLEVERKFTEPDPVTRLRIKREAGVKQQLFKRITPQRLWSGPFDPPLQSIVTEPFGSQRTFNGVRQSIHQGLDYRAATGTPVLAMNSGIIAVARNFFYDGGLIVVDHGYGLLTMYLHLSEFRVREGDRIARGQIVGLSGGTGRVTSPHLHVGARWQGTYVNPLKLMELALP